MDYVMDCILASKFINFESCDKSELKRYGIKIFNTPNIISKKSFRDLYDSYNSERHMHWRDHEDISLVTLLMSDIKYLKSIKFILENWEFFGNSLDNLVSRFLSELLYFENWIPPHRKYEEFINKLLPIFEPYHYEVINFLNDDYNEFWNADMNLVLKLLNRYNYNKEFRITPEFLYCLTANKDAFVYYYTRYKDEVSEPKFVSEFDLIKCMNSYDIEWNQYIIENCQGIYDEEKFIGHVFSSRCEYAKLNSFDIFKKFFPLSEELLAEMFSSDWVINQFDDSDISILTKLIEASDKVSPFSLKIFLDKYNSNNNNTIKFILDFLLIRNPVETPELSPINVLYYGEYALAESENLFHTNNKTESWKANFMVYLNTRRTFEFIKQNRSLP